MGSKVIRVDEQVYSRLQEIAKKNNKAFISPNNIIRIVLGMPAKGAKKG